SRMSRQRFPCFIGFHPWSNCFGYAVREGTRHAQLPPTLPPLGFFRLRHCENENIMANVQILGAPPFSTLLLNGSFARLLGFDEGDEVILESLPPPLTCEVVEIAPLSANDYQIIESGTDVIENGLLSQLRVVSHRARFVFFMSKSLSAAFRVVSITPSPPDGRLCLLTNSTELHVQSAPSVSLPPVEGKRRKTKNVVVERVAQRTSSIISSSLSSFSLLSSSSPLQSHLILRILPSSLRNERLRRAIEHPSLIYTIDPSLHYTSLHVVRASSLSSPSSPFFLLIRIPLGSEEVGRDSTMTSVAEALKWHRHHGIASSSSFSDFERILLKPVPTKNLHHLTRAILTVPKSTKVEMAEAHIRSLLSSHPILIPFKGISIRLPGHSTVISLTPDPTTMSGSTRLCFVADDNSIVIVKEQETDLDSLVSNHKEEEKEEKKFLPFERDQDERLFQLPWQSSLTSTLLSWLDSCSDSPFFDGRCVLITGPSGSGKTEQLRNVGHAAAHSTHAYCTYLMDGTSMKGRSAENIEKTLSGLMDNLTSRAPSILLIDNLDFIASSQEEETRIIPVERVFTVLWRLLSSRRGVHVICSSRRLTSIHSSLIGNGRRFFHRIENIEALNQSHREIVLRAAIECARGKYDESSMRILRRSPSQTKEDEWSTRIEEAARSMENSSVEELVKIVRRCEIEAFMPDHDGIMMPADLMKVAAEWRKKSDSGSKKGGRVEKTLRDVGGMHQQKKLMQEVMLWPYKYSSLFSRFRIRLGRGIILHGPSGCGKTLLAQAMVAESGFNLISVKGPELLSKYIGSSEENVRAVFERARSAAPSVLFFDEIDSLAPRRGSDTSGVSDRVVNQLLTEMDGAEGLTGVFVLGATSRLDLIDEALIRPGRFDYSIHCGVPDENDRMEILEVLLRENRRGKKKMDLRGLSQSTESWTGADLKTLTTNAFFRAQQELKEASGEEVEEENIEITLDHLNGVLDESRPRVRRVEKGLGIERGTVGLSATQA
ncbi:prx-1, partial [Pristionchus pacificus]